MCETAHEIEGLRGVCLVRRLATCGVLSMLAVSLAPVGVPREAHAGGDVDAVTIQVTGSALSNVTSSPLSLSPAFAPEITDYVWHCERGINPIQLTLAAVSGGTV